MKLGRAPRGHGRAKAQPSRADGQELRAGDLVFLARRIEALQRTLPHPAQGALENLSAALAYPLAVGDDDALRRP